MSLSVAGAGIGRAQTQQAPQPPYSLFQSSAVVATGNIITLTRVPVVLRPGTTVYKDITLQLDVDQTGSFSITSGFPLVADSPSLQVSSFVPGKYVGPNNVNYGKNLLTVSGPGVVSGGVTAYTFTLTSGADTGTYPSGGIWYVGPIENSPLADRLKKAGITSPAWSYGTATGNHSVIWPSNMIIGVSQVGNTLTFASFTTTGSDKNQVVDQITYTLDQQN